MRSELSYIVSVTPLSNWNGTLRTVKWYYTAAYTYARQSPDRDAVMGRHAILSTSMSTADAGREKYHHAEDMLRELKGD